MDGRFDRDRNSGDGTTSRRGLAVAYHARDREVGDQERDRADDGYRRPAAWAQAWASELPKERF
jgi:hypothetical protein